MYNMLIKLLQNQKRNWLESKVKREEVEVRSEAKQFPRTEYRSPRMKKRNLITTLKEGEVHKEDNMLIGTLFLYARGRGRERGGEIKCFFCGKIRHKYFECLYRKIEGGGEAHIS
jgi:hypothetical protein